MKQKLVDNLPWILLAAEIAIFLPFYIALLRLLWH